MPKGSQIYEINNSHIIAHGMQFTENELGEILNTVTDKIFKVSDIEEIIDNFGDLSLTGFHVTELKSVLIPSHKLNSWKIGESFVQCYLEQNENCLFWSSDKDAKSDNAILTGTDLVGFQKDNNSHRFAFGEVKTSSEQKCPPQVVTAKDGLKQQLIDLINSDLENTLTGESKVHTLIRYLSYRSKDNSSLFDKFKEATQRFLKNKYDIILFGILIRDIVPNKKDLERLAKDLSGNTDPTLSIRLLAIYLPLGAIEKLPSDITQIKGNHYDDY